MQTFLFGNYCWKSISDLPPQIWVNWNVFVSNSISTSFKTWPETHVVVFFFNIKTKYSLNFIFFLMLHKPLWRSIGFSRLSLFMTVILQETRGACSLGAGCWVCWALQCAVSRCELRSGIFPCVCTRNYICGVSQFLVRLVALHPASKCFSWLKRTANAHCNNTSWLSLLRHRNTGILDGIFF